MGFDADQVMRRRVMRTAEVAVPGGDHFVTVERRRSTVVCGEPGTGKTFMAVEFLVNGADEWGDSGVYVSCSESAAELVNNTGSLGSSLRRRMEDGHIAVIGYHCDPVHPHSFDEIALRDLFRAVDAAVGKIGARRIAVDAWELLIETAESEEQVRSLTLTLLKKLKDSGLTSLMTALRGDGKHLTRHGVAEYECDRVVLLEHGAEPDTRFMSVIKNRGSRFAPTRVPMTIDARGIHVLGDSAVSVWNTVTPGPADVEVPRALCRAHGTRISGMSQQRHE